MAKTRKTGAKNAKGKYKNPTAAINSGKMEKKSGEIVSPGKIIFKAAAKLAGTKAAKAAKKVSTSGYGMSKKGLTVSNDVRIKSSTSSSKLKVNPGAKQAIDQNIKTANKTTKAEAKANARALKAANKDVGIKYKKGYNESNYSGRNESKPKQVAKSKVRSTSNSKAPMTSPSSYKEAKSGYNTWAKKNPKLVKENPPSGKFGPGISRSEKEMKRLNKLNKKSN
jgi:hypothetical protein